MRGECLFSNKDIEALTVDDVRGILIELSSPFIGRTRRTYKQA